MDASDIMMLALVSVAQGYYLPFLTKLMNFYNVNNPLQILRTSSDGDFEQVASFETSVAFLGYQSNEDINEIARKVTELQTLGKLDMIIIHGTDHQDLIHMLVNAMKVFNSGVTGVILDSEIRGMNLELQFNTRLFCFAQGASGILLTELYAIKGMRFSNIIGTWNKTQGINVQIPNIWERRTDLDGVTIRATSIDTTVSRLHFFRYDESNSIIGGGGFFIEPLYYLALKLNFTMKFLPSIDGTFGSKSADGTWKTGMIGMLVKDQADLITAPVTCNLERATTAITCSFPLMDNEATLIAPVTETRIANVWAYLDIFTNQSWSLCITLIIILAVLFTVLNASGTNYLHNVDDSENFNLINGLGLSMLYLMQLSYDICSTTISSKILLLTAGMGCYLIFAYYGAVLTTTMTVTPKEPSIKSFDDVIRYEYNVIVAGSTSYHDLLKRALPGTGMHKIYYDTMEGNPDSFIPSTKAAVSAMFEREKTLFFGSKFWADEDKRLQVLDIKASPFMEEF